MIDKQEPIMQIISHLIKTVDYFKLLVDKVVTFQSKEKSIVVEINNIEVLLNINEFDFKLFIEYIGLQTSEKFNEFNYTKIVDLINYSECFLETFMKTKAVLELLFNDLSNCRIKIIVSQHRSDKFIFLASCGESMDALLSTKTHASFVKLL